MDITTIQAAKQTFAFSPGAAKLFDKPAPYVVGFVSGPQAHDLPYPQVVVSSGSGSSKLKIDLVAEQGDRHQEIGLSEAAAPFAAQPDLQLDSFPLWPIAVLEPSDSAHAALMDQFLDSLPERIRDSLVRMPHGGDISAALHDAMRQHTRELFEHMVSADRAVVELRELHELTQRAFQELEQFVQYNSKTDTALLPVRLPRGRQTVRMTSGMRIVQRLIADTYRFSGVEIELSSVPDAGGVLTASVTRQGDSEPFAYWDVDLADCSRGPLLLRLQRALLEQATEMSLSLELSLEDEAEQLGLAATGQQILSHLQAQIIASETTNPSQYTIAHAVYRGVPGVATAKHRAEVLSRDKASAPKRRGAGVVKMRADFERPKVLAPSGAAFEALTYPVAVLLEDPGELQVHPVEGEPVLTSIPIPNLDTGSVLNVPVRVAHEEAPELLVRLLYGPVGAEQPLLRLLPKLLSEAEVLASELQSIGVSATECWRISGTDDPAEVSLPISTGTIGKPSRLYVALRTLKEDAGVAYGWFRLHHPTVFHQDERHSSGDE